LLGHAFRSLFMLKEAMNIFEFLRDLADEFNNYSQLILAFESMSKVFNDMHLYELGLVAAKKMM